jgi:hypothetical protein
MAHEDRDLRLAEGLRAHGLKNARATIEEARRVGLPLSYALAFLEKESRGTDTDGVRRFGLNLFGHDGVPNPVKGGWVTEARYRQYRTNRRAGMGMQGVGPCQLTWWEFQDMADRLGGCWVPRYNMRVGFGIAKGLIRQHGKQAGAARWNGSGTAAQNYGRDWIDRQRQWHATLAELGAGHDGSDDSGAGRPPKQEPDSAQSGFRSLHLTSPHMTGADVRRLQRKLRVDADGDYGPLTARAVRGSKRALGFHPKRWATGATVFYQALLYGRRPVPDEYRARAERVKARDAQAAAEAAKRGGSRSKAADWLIARANRHESAVPNRADWLDRWQMQNGHARFTRSGEEGWAWCGIACWAAYRYGAGIMLDGRLRSTDWIYVAAAANTNRLRRVPLAQGRKGDMVLLFKRGAHVGMLAADYTGGMVPTIEGNTSPGPGGGLRAQANGGGIYRRSRSPGEIVAGVRVTA